MIEAFIAEKRSTKGSVKYLGKPIGDDSLRVGLVALRLILDRAVQVHHVLTVNPALRVVKFRRPEAADKVDAFNGEELRAILMAASDSDPVFEVFLRLWMQTGMRLGEVSALQNRDFDLVTGTVIVRRTFSGGRIGPPKTRQTRVVNFLHPTTEDTFEWMSTRSGVRSWRRRRCAIGTPSSCATRSRRPCSRGALLRSTFRLKAAGRAQP